MRNTVKKRCLLLLLAILALSCSRHAEIPVPVLLPLEQGSEIKYVSYVTDSLKQILHPLEYFPRYYVRSDSSASVQKHYYIENKQLNYYQVDRHGEIATRVVLDLGAFAAAAGLPYTEPIPFTYWRTVFKKDRGIGTRWSVAVDTQIVVRDAAAQLRTLKFGHFGQARLEDWTEVTVPASKGEILRVLNVHWTDMVTFLYEPASGDTLWSQHAEARELYEPRFGLTRSMSSYRIHKLGSPSLYRQSTMDLYLLMIPDKPGR